VKLKRFSPLAAGLVVGALLLSACGSDNNSATGAGTSDSASPAAAAGTCASGTLNAEGSSAQQNAIDEVIASFTSDCADATINYNPTGSGAGITQFTAGQVDFAGSDSALKAEAGEVAKAKQRCQGNDAWNLPMVTGPIAIAYNVKGVDSLVLTPEVAAKIFKGAIKTWDDPAVAALNKNTKLPSAAIKVFFRSDESGTTENFQKYLSGAAPKVWTDAPSKTWPGAGEGREKSSGVAEGVKSTADSVTYVEWSYAKDSNLGVSQIDNGAGPVQLTGEAVGKAVAAAKQAGTGNDLRLSLDYTTQEAGAYPILLVTYEVVCSKGLDAGKTALLKDFLTFFSSTQTQNSLEQVGYAPLPEQVRTKVEAAVKAIS
jgi:phosphate transport system substrate-binding protein